MSALIILDPEGYQNLRAELKDAGLDLCYSARSARPLRRRWGTDRTRPVDKREDAFGLEVTQRRPSDPAFRIATVEVVKPGNWLFPPQFSVTFHAASAEHDEAVQRYLATHHIQAPNEQEGEDGHEADGHATPKTYVGVALVLGLVTLVEVAAFYLPGSLRPPSWALMVVLMLLSAFKFGVVASFFMHLRYDHRLLAGCFAGGLIVATGTILALLLLFRDPSHPLIQSAEAKSRGPGVELTRQPSPPIGDAESGELAFQQYGCGGCHTISRLPQARGHIGPGLDGLAQRAESRVAGMTRQAYLRQSIENPAAYVVKGYLNLMPALRASMSDQEFRDILALLGTL